MVFIHHGPGTDADGRRTTVPLIYRLADGRRLGWCPLLMCEGVDSMVLMVSRHGSLAE